MPDAEVSGMILFKPVTGTGGAVRYVRWLAATFDFPVYTLYSEYESPVPGWDDIDVHEIGRRPRLPLVGRRVGGDTLDRLEYAFWKPPREYDVVVSSGLPTKATVHHPHQRRIHLMHGFHKGAIGLPPRDQFSDNAFLATLQKLNRTSLRSREQFGLELVDDLVANSEYTRTSVECYFSTSVGTVAPPPVDVSDFEDQRPGDEEFYLYLGELREYKRVTEIVEAFSDLPHRLVVAGSGPLQSTLREQAPDNVEVVGRVSEQRKRELFGTCRGFVQNSMGETFGVTTVEALAAGAPVVAVDDGNNPHLVEDGKTGVIYDADDTVSELRAAVRRAEGVDWDHEYIQSTARQYGHEECRRTWETLLAEESTP